MDVGDILLQHFPRLLTSAMAELIAATSAATLLRSWAREEPARLWGTTSSGICRGIVAPCMTSRHPALDAGRNRSQQINHPL